ncbi:MAG: hypothetical protein H6832_11600 [Planctomycetes bacterium]|nr:hypothetical protein [Planctomycetota bacterium]MCB9919036.1 hypothetical protein [Planctomycetota bacterium]
MTHANLVLLACLAFIVTYGLVVHAFLAVGIDLPGMARLALLAIAAVVPFVLAFLARRRSPHREGRRASTAEKRMLLGCLALAVIVLVPIGIALITTGPREWDGRVAWELRAVRLSTGGYFQPFFTEIGVYSPAREYPLLQPLVLADLSRIVGLETARFVFPALFVVLVVGIFGTLERGLGRPVAILMAASFFVLPGFIGTGAGNIDSGYGELIVALFLCGVGSALAGAPGSSRTTRWQTALFCVSVAGLPMLKPEGTAYAWLALIAGIHALPKHGVVLGSVFTGISCGLVAAVRAHAIPMQAERIVLVACAPLVVILMRAALDSVPAARRALRTVIVAGTVGLLIAATLMLVTVSGSMDAVVDGGFARVASRLRDLPRMLLGSVAVAFDVRKFALLWGLTALALASRSRTADGQRALGAFVVLGLVAAFASLFLVPENDLDHELVSRFDRLLLQWTAPAWVFVGLRLFTTEELHLASPHGRIIPRNDNEPRS